MNLKNILKYGVLIGSQAYGVSHENSDYDIVLTEDDYYKVCEKNDMVSCSNIGKEDSDDEYNYSIFGSGLSDIGRFTSDDGFDINVFLYTDPIGDIDMRVEDVKEEHIYDRFKKHNMMMKSNPLEDLADRDHRIKLFIHNLAYAGIMERCE